MTAMPTTAELIKLIGTIDELPEAEQAKWISVPAAQVKIGETAYVYSMGRTRRGIVTKVGRNRVTVAFTTQGALDEATKYNQKYAGNRTPRVQNSAKPETDVYVCRTTETPTPVATVETETPKPAGVRIQKGDTVRVVAGHEKAGLTGIAYCLDSDTVDIRTADGFITFSRSSLEIVSEYFHQK